VFREAPRSHCSGGSTVPSPQLLTHAPALQCWVALQAAVHEPQWALLDDRSKHAPPQLVWPGRQQVPDEQTMPAVQA
jgi:hypothetical protein